MPEIVQARMCVEVTGQVVVFAIGMRINRPWKLWKWLPLIPAMTRMPKEQMADPATGMLSTRPMIGLRDIAVLQLWRSAEDLRAYAHDPARNHLAEWQRFNARIGTSGDVGIWHETCVVPAGNIESVFVNMPRHGLGEAGELFPAKGERASAARKTRPPVRGLFAQDRVYLILTGCDRSAASVDRLRRPGVRRPHAR